MCPWRPEFGPEGKHFVTGNSLFFVFGGAAKLRWAGGRAGVAMSPKRRVRAAHGRARAAKNPLVNIYLWNGVIGRRKENWNGGVLLSRCRSVMMASGWL
jgi:hypothetical protein